MVSTVFTFAGEDDTAMRDAKDLVIYGERKILTENRHKLLQLLMRMDWSLDSILDTVAPMRNMSQEEKEAYAAKVLSQMTEHPDSESGTSTTDDIS